MTTPIDDMLQNLIEKLHAARFAEASPTIADLHQVATALEDTRRMTRGTATGLIEAQATRIKLLEEQNQHRIDLAFHRIERVDQLVATDKTDYRAILGAVADLGDRVKKLESPSIGDAVKGLADDMRKLAALRDIPVTPDRIATSTGDDLDEVADALGLSRKGWPCHEVEADDALRVRCAAALFGQSMTRELARSVATDARRAWWSNKSAETFAPETCPEWVVDAVMAAAGAHPDGRPLDQQSDLAVAMERDITVALGLAPESVAWPRCLELVRQAVEAVTALGSLRQRITTLEERNTKQAQTIAELQDINARGISTVVDQAAQITALRAEVKRSGTIDGADALPLIAAALQWRKDAVVRCGALEEPERDLDVLVTIGDVVWHRYELPLVKAIDEYMASKATTAEIAALTGAT